MTITAYLRRLAGAALLSLLVIAGVMLGSPQHTYAATPVVAGGKAIVVNTDGDNVRVRASAGTGNNIVGYTRQGDNVSVLEGPVKDSKGTTWWKVQAPAATGWMMADFLTGKEAAPQPQAQPQAPKLEGFASVGNSGGDPVRLRSEPNRNGSVLARFAAGTSVAVKAGPQTDPEGTAWYQISAQGLTGWMMAQYLVQESAPPPTSNVPTIPAAPAPATAPEAPKAETANQTAAQTETQTPPVAQEVVAPSTAESVPSTGAQAVSVALKYLGSRYVFGGTSPRGFDCSGFVYYVYQKQLGIPIGRDMFSQLASGSRISRINLQPGDIVFFANTYKRGLSHAGIYIGGGRFVHAENESTGVTTSSLSSSYWNSHYYSATRPAR